MPERYFELADDVNVPHRWHLAMPRDTRGLAVDDSLSRSGEHVDMAERLKIPVGTSGTPLDFTEAGIGIPVVHVRVAAVFAELAPDEAQLLPVDVEGWSGSLIISGQIKDALEHMGATGTRFEEV